MNNNINKISNGVFLEINFCLKLSTNLTIFAKTPRWILSDFSSIKIITQILLKGWRRYNCFDNRNSFFRTKDEKYIRNNKNPISFHTLYHVFRLRDYSKVTRRWNCKVLPSLRQPDIYNYLNWFTSQTGPIVEFQIRLCYDIHEIMLHHWTLASI